jgi:hypothetical protein
MHHNSRELNIFLGSKNQVDKITRSTDVCQSLVTGYTSAGVMGTGSG